MVLADDGCVIITAVGEHTVTQGGLLQAIYLIAHQVIARRLRFDYRVFLAFGQAVRRKLNSLALVKRGLPNRRQQRHFVEGMRSLIEFEGKQNTGINALVNAMAVHDLLFQHRLLLEPHAGLGRLSGQIDIRRCGVMIAEGVPGVLTGRAIRAQLAIVADLQHPHGGEHSLRQRAVFQSIDLGSQCIRIQLQTEGFRGRGAGIPYAGTGPILGCEGSIVGEF